MCVSTKEMSFFGDLICRPSSSCPRRSPFSAKARFACGRFAGAPLELTLPRFFPSRVVSRSICFVRSKQARTTSSSAPRFAAKRSTSASFSQHESSRSTSPVQVQYKSSTSPRSTALRGLVFLISTYSVHLQELPVPPSFPFARKREPGARCGYKNAHLLSLGRSR